MSSYYEKLKDPRWQRRRLEIFNAAEFTCQECASDDRPLHAHHLEYVKGKDPWDYSNSQIVCLCEDCHEQWHQAKQTLDSVVAGLRADGLVRVAGYALAIASMYAIPGPDTPFPLGFFGKGWGGLLGSSSGTWVKGLSDAVVGLRNDGDDSAAWKVAERLDDVRCQVSKKQIAKLIYGDDLQFDEGGASKPLTESRTGAA